MPRFINFCKDGKGDGYFLTVHVNNSIQPIEFLFNFTIKTWNINEYEYNAAVWNCEQLSLHDNVDIVIMIKIYTFCIILYVLFLCYYK